MDVEETQPADRWFAIHPREVPPVQSGQVSALIYEQMRGQAVDPDFLPVEPDDPEVPGLGYTEPVPREPSPTAGEQDHSDPWGFAGDEADPPEDTGRPGG